MYLPPGTELNQRYLIESLLGHGGFGITYAAHDKLLNVRVAIKEYLPRQLATRGEGRTQVSIFTGEARQQYYYGLRKFLEEAQSVARFAHHPNVVSARDYFEANGTAYIVMEYVEGVTLKGYLEKKGGRISFEEARGILMPVMDALREVHQAGMLHRDISPDNIYITTEAQVRVIDFGAARYFAGEQSKSLSVILKSGYAPEEQYRSSGKQGAWTDVYAVGATIYKCLTGQTPPDALDRMAEDTLIPPSRLGVAIPPAAEQALLQALAVNAGIRFHSIEEFQQALLGDTTLTPVFAQPAAPPSQYPQMPRRSATAAVIGAGVLSLALAVVLIWWLVGGNLFSRGNVTPLTGQPDNATGSTIAAVAKPAVVEMTVMGQLYKHGEKAQTLWCIEPWLACRDKVYSPIHIDGISYEEKKWRDAALRKRRALRLSKNLTFWLYDRGVEIGTLEVEAGTVASDKLFWPGKVSWKGKPLDELGPKEIIALSRPIPQNFWLPPERLTPRQASDFKQLLTAALTRLPAVSHDGARLTPIGGQHPVGKIIENHFQVMDLDHDGQIEVFGELEGKGKPCTKMVADFFATWRGGTWQALRQSTYWAYCPQAEAVGDPHFEVTPVDLDGDGRAEVFIKHGFYESWGISLFHYEGGRLVKQLEVGEGGV